MKVIYNVTVNIDHDVKDEWLKWMKDVHIPEVLETGLFIEAKLSKILAESEGGESFSIQYMLHSMEDYHTYEREHAPKLQEKHHKKWADKSIAFRTLLHIEEIFQK
ncbi:MAG TPA: DUF4286 family protein [Crocinitomix sp.]|nr:DUF4286 family protein [Crocinitomix sp.]